MIKEHEIIDVFIGVDVGKSNYHAAALNKAGKKPIGQGEAQGPDQVSVQARETLVRGGQLATIGAALPGAVAQAEGIQVAYLPGLAMRCIADLHPGEAKSDPRDAYIIAEAARTMPRTLCTSRPPKPKLLSCRCSADSKMTWPSRPPLPPTASAGY